MTGDNEYIEDMAKDEPIKEFTAYQIANNGMSIFPNLNRDDYYKQKFFKKEEVLKLIEDDGLKGMDENWINLEILRKRLEGGKNGRNKINN